VHNWPAARSDVTNVYVKSFCCYCDRIESSGIGNVDPEDGGGKLLRNVSAYLPIYEASYRKRLGFSVLLQAEVFWDFTPCRWLYSYRRFGEV
jgi:hypothetical protein